MRETVRVVDSGRKHSMAPQSHHNRIGNAMKPSIVKTRCDRSDKRGNRSNAISERTLVYMKQHAGIKRLIVGLNGQGLSTSLFDLFHSDFD